MYLKPWQWKIRSLLGTSRTLADICSKCWQLAPGYQQTIPPGIYNTADLQRITGTPGVRSRTTSRDSTHIAQQVARLRGGTVYQEATTAYLLKNVDAVDGYLYCGQWKGKQLDVWTPFFSRGPSSRMAFGTLASTYNGSLYFGHWIVDDLTLFLAAQDTGNPFVIERKPYQHESEYRRLLNIPREAVRRTRFDEMLLIRDVGQNEYKRRRYDELRRRLRLAVPVKGGERIFLRRGSTGHSRSLTNAAEIETYLASQGYEILDPETLSATDIARMTMDAKVVVGVEGSHLFHALLTMAEGGVLCCLQPPSRFTLSLRHFTDCLGIGYAAVVGHPVGAGFRLGLEDLVPVLEKIERVI